MKIKHQYNTKSHTFLFISHYQLVRYESSCGHKIEEVTPKQTGNEHGRSEKSKTKQTNREESGHKEAGVKVACNGHRRQEGIQEGKPRNKRQAKAK